MSDSAATWVPQMADYEQVLQIAREAEAARTQGIEQLEQTVRLLDDLQRSAADGIGDPGQISASGPLLEALKSNPPSTVNDALKIWSDYFAQNLQDLAALVDDVKTSVIKDPESIFQIVHMADRLVRMAAVSIEQQAERAAA